MRKPMTRSTRDCLLWVALAVLLPWGLAGCGGGATSAGTDGSDAPGDLPPNARQGELMAFDAIARRSWADMAADPRNQEAPAVEAAPEGAADEQTPTGTTPTSAASSALRLPGGPEPLVVTNGFEALPQSFSIPPDTMGAAGPDHLVTMLNDQVLVQDKLGNQVVAPVTLEAFFSTIVGANLFDPRVMYDPIDDRWLATANRDARQATSGVVFGISDTPDPTGMWTFYSFDLDPMDNNWADFVSMGFNNQWIALTTDALQIGGGYVGEHMWVIDKASALAGGLLTVTQFTPGFSTTPTAGVGRRLKPAVTYDAGEGTLYMCSTVYNVAGTEFIRLSAITGTGPAPVWAPLGPSVFPGSGLFQPVNAYQAPGFATFPPAPQMGSATGIDTGRALMSSEPQFRNGRLWFCHTGGVPAVGAVLNTSVFWYEVDPTAMPAPIVQSGVLSTGGGVSPGEVISQLATDSTIAGGGAPGQSFTVSVTGSITALSFDPAAAYPAGTLDVYAGAGNGGALLASQPLPAGPSGFQTVPLAPTVPVTPGTYTFYVNTAIPFPGIRGQSGNVYPGGIMYAGAGTVGNTDLVFRVDIAGGPLPADWLYYPSIAVNAQNDVCIGCARSSPTLFVEGIVAGRDGGDPLGTLDPVVVAKAGEASYVQLDNNMRNRWGDYSATVVDPADDMTIWSIQEYAEDVPANTWSTWWTRHAVAPPITLTADITWSTDTTGGTAGPAPIDCAVPVDGSGTPAVSVFAECTDVDGSDVTLGFTATAPSGAPIDVSLIVDGMVEATQTSAGVVPGPSMITSSFTTTLAVGGPYLVEVLADDGTGDADRCAVLVTVQDTTPPSITCPPNVGPLECTGPAGAEATWADPVVVDVCDPAPTVSCVVSASPNPAALPVGTPVTSPFTFPLGVTTIMCTATDTAGNTASCSFTVTVVDTTPPTLDFFVRRPMLFLPRGGMIRVLINWTATDLCDPAPTVDGTIYSDQPDADGLVGDCSFVVPTLGGFDLALRAEVDLDGPLPGRVYLLVLNARDASGNVATECTWVIVPKTATFQDVLGTRNNAVAAEAICDGTGIIPVGFSNIPCFWATNQSSLSN